MTTKAIEPRYITLSEWAARMFSKVPHNNTLLKWVHEGRIQPQPKKMGRAWQVRPTAEYQAD
ncbi:excisionase [Janthinobacterium fluminis]|uniref:Excisionase n=1 Tax=Janthinobacterium fluminis TaxID=2987524 RepID=A0ABT5JUZ2_9BURK|nr:excisionase [Janthinobacterium fluminis]MDC8756225.1 excisionase [Janthinobacterium fluminis]